MIKGLYTSKAGLLPRQRQLEIVANNLANTNTIGFKKDQVFYRHLIDSMNAADSAENNESLRKDEIVTDFTSGTYRETGNPLDMAIVDDGFFVIRTPEGDLYTRNGNFSLDTQGRLTTQDGYPVLGANGQIQFAGNDFSISENGTIQVNDREVDHLRVVRFDDPGQLTKIGGTYFSDSGESLAIDVAPENLRLRQGYLEGSNVSGVEEIITMIELNRQFEMAQKAISTQDQTLEKLVNDAGRV
ncbi:MAG: flagellar basal-body rod protein FlgF [Calditrichia bacterium]